MKFTKPRFWDLKRPTFIAYLLTPLTVFVCINNLLLSLKKKKKIK